MRLCSIEGCGKKHRSMGYCNMHYIRSRVGWDLSNPPVIRRTGKMKTKHPYYRTYRSMINRTKYPSEEGYKHYGGRGILVCDRWLCEDGFINFISDMGERPEGYSLERINNDGNYEPQNCKRASRSEQALNKRNSRKNRK